MKETKDDSGVQPDDILFLMLQPLIPGKKLTQKDDADSGVQFITPAGPRQSLLLAKDPDRPVFVKTLYTLSVRAQTHLPKFPETSLNKGKRKIQSKLTPDSYALSLGS